MAGSSELERARVEGWADEEIMKRVLDGDGFLFELLMRRHNQRVYRAIRSILRDDAECEEVMQETYVRAFEHLAQFEGRAQFSTWLTRIAVNEALRRLAARGRFEPLDLENYEEEERAMPAFHSELPTPESSAANSELRSLLEQAVLALPLAYRTVLVLRDVEEMSTADTAEALSISDVNVKVRLHRAHELLRKQLFARVGSSSSQAFEFHATRCDRVVRTVFERLELNDRNSNSTIS